MLFENSEIYILPFVVLAPTLGAFIYVSISVISQILSFLLEHNGHSYLKTHLTFLKRPNAIFGAIICSVLTLASFVGLLYSLNPLKTDFQLISTTL